MNIYLFALKYGAASRTVPFIAAYPLVTFLIAISFLGEKVTLMKGAGLVVLGLLFNEVSYYSHELDITKVYKGVISDDRWKNPYVSAKNLKEEINSKVHFL